jgi:hypothetical protein
MMPYIWARTSTVQQILVMKSDLQGDTMQQVGFGLRIEIEDGE